jgi:hypothetical protein
MATFSSRTQEFSEDHMAVWAIMYTVNLHLLNSLSTLILITINLTGMLYFQVLCRARTLIDHYNLHDELDFLRKLSGRRATATGS